MNYQSMIEKAVDYMESHLDLPLTNKSCSDYVGYSEFHFQKIFKGVVGYSPMDYLRKRRLSKAVILLAQDKSTIYEVAFNVGFNSPEHFTRAFKAEHGITPKNYRKTMSSLHVLDAYTRTNVHAYLPPKISDREAIGLRCHIFETDEVHRHHDIPRFWNIYHQKALYKDFTEDDNRIDYGWLEKTEDGVLRYWIGCQPSRQNLTKGYNLVIPKGTYACFKTPKADAFTFVETIHETWRYILEQGLASHDLKVQGPYAYECYQENSRQYSEEIYIPIALEELK